MNCRIVAHGRPAPARPFISAGGRLFISILSRGKDSDVFYCITWWIAFKEFRDTKGNVGYWKALKRIKDPNVITVLFEDTASLAGLLFAFLGIFLGKLLNLPMLDGVASVLIGVLLGGVAIGLICQCKMLLIGESANPEVVHGVRALVEHDDSVTKIEDLLTMHFGPQDILVSLKVRFRENIDTRQLGDAVDRIEHRLREEND